MDDYNYYGLLMEFTNGSTPCREHLVKRYSENIVESAIKKGYIREYGQNTLGDTIYCITEKGKYRRDK